MSSTELMTLGSPFLNRRVILHVAESKLVDLDQLYRRLLEGSYDRPFLMDEDCVRTLCFNLDGWVQGAMDLRDPERLLSVYTQKMMGFALLHPDPSQILMLGLGTGSLLKFCRRHFPSSVITVVEVNPAVIAMREQFYIPPDDGRVRVVLDEGSRFIASTAVNYEVILVDAYDRDGLAEEISTTEFLESARSRLCVDGVLVVNLAGERSSCLAYIERLKRVFEDRAIAIPIPLERTMVVFAFRSALRPSALTNWERSAEIVRQRMGLKFPRLRQCVQAHVMRSRARGSRTDRLLERTGIKR